MGDPALRNPQPVEQPRKPLNIVKQHSTNDNYSDNVRAGVGIRFLAALIDGTVIGIVTKIFMFPFQTQVDQMLVTNPSMYWAVTLGAGAVFTFAVYAFPTSQFGMTLGKKALGLRVVRLDGSTEIGLLRAFSREYFGKLISAFTLMIGYLMAYGSEKRALHDRMTDTIVVKTGLKKNSIV